MTLFSGPEPMLTLAGRTGGGPENTVVLRVNPDALPELAPGSAQSTGGFPHASVRDRNSMMKFGARARML